MNDSRYCIITRVSAAAAAAAAAAAPAAAAAAPTTAVLLQQLPLPLAHLLSHGCYEAISKCNGYMEDARTFEVATVGGGAPYEIGPP